MLGVSDSQALVPCGYPGGVCFGSIESLEHGLAPRRSPASDLTSASHGRLGQPATRPAANGVQAGRAHSERGKYSRHTMGTVQGRRSRRGHREATLTKPFGPPALAAGCARQVRLQAVGGLARGVPSGRAGTEGRAEQLATCLGAGALEPQPLGLGRCHTAGRQAPQRFCRPLWAAPSCAQLNQTPGERRTPHTASARLSSPATDACRAVPLCSASDAPTATTARGASGSALGHAPVFV